MLEWAEQEAWVDLGRAERTDELAPVRVLRGLGSDSVFWMHGGASTSGSPAPARTRGDLVVRLRVAPHPVFAPDTVLYPCDLHAVVTVGLVARYYGAVVELRHLDRRVLEVAYEAQGGAYADETDAEEATQTRVFPGEGLPYGPASTSGPAPGQQQQQQQQQQQRGDLFVFLKHVPPRVCASVLAIPGVRATLEALDQATPVASSVML